MSTIPDTMKIISRDVQCVFEELVKLLLRKSLRPALNPIGTNKAVIYNNFRGKYERGLVKSCPNDYINKYNYVMTNDSLGWTDEILVNFKIMAKFIKSNVVQRFPVGSIKTNSNNFNSNRNSNKNGKQKTKMAFSNKKKTCNSNQYKKFLSFLTSRSVHDIISNRNCSSVYVSDIPYTHAFKQLECIGKDIIDQTDPSICGADSARMSTSMLRVRLYTLEQDLANLSVENPNIYDAYVEMLRIINCVSRNKITWIINLIGILSYQRWEDIGDNQKRAYIDTLGADFIDLFNSNELITILLQSGNSEVILTSSYLYPLLKMLFIAFGYSRLIPTVTDNCSSDLERMKRDKLRKHFEKYRGASFRRGDSRDLRDSKDNFAEYLNCRNNNENYQNRPDVDRYDSYNDYDYNDRESQDEYDQVSSESPHNRYGSSERNIPNYFPRENGFKPDPEPVDQMVYDFITLFGDLYPTIIGLMGGTEQFPPETIEISCDDIPPTYDCLASLQEYLWRFNDYSYCRFLEHVNSKQMCNALNSKINAKIKYLNSM